ncbi:unnamed protein product [Auanema sp. JU1783]|nr:unnamed protein product [Auanema sp. JU1783]
MSFEIGSRIITEKNGKGRVAFFGATKFADGDWVGVILDDPKGKNNGTVQEVAYFQCEEKYGLFVRPTQIKLEADMIKTRSGGALKAPASVLKSAKPSPKTSPKMSPAASMERIVKATPSRKSSSIAKASDATDPSISREASTLSQSDAPSRAIPVIHEKGSPNSETVQARVRKMEETGTASLSSPKTEIPEDMDLATQNEYLRMEVKDLAEKVETLRYKCKENHAKLQESERNHVQLQSLNELKTKLTDQNLELIRQVEEAKREADEIREWRNVNQEQMSNAAEELEMALIDKEMAEEKCDILQKECDAHKEKVDELQADLEILREEMSSGGGAAPEGNSVQMKQLEAQNERLKEALIKLRDLHGQAQADMQIAQKEAEILRSEHSELIRAAEVAQNVASEAEKRVLDYREQMEAAMGAEEMIMALTNKNMDMEEQIRSLEQEKEDLEALRDMDEQIAEAQKQVERDLLKDIELQQIKFTEFIQKLKDEEKHSDDLMATIIKFRQRTTELNEEIQDLKDQILRYEERLSGEQIDEKNIASMASQLQVNASRAFVESVERQLSLIDLEFARKQAGYLKAFLPDNFTRPGGDNDAVLVNVLFPRLSAKAALFTKLVAERFPGVPGGIRREHVTKSHKAEQWAQSARVNHMCSALIYICGQFESAIQCMTIEQLAKLSQLQSEMSIHEKSVDSFIELLRQGRFDENTSLENLEKAVMYFQNVFSIHVGGDEFDAAKYVSLVCKHIMAGTDWAKVNTQRILFFLLEGNEESDVFNVITNIEGDLERFKQLAIRASKRVPNDRKLRLLPEFSDDIQAIVSNMNRFGSLLHEASSIASLQIIINPEPNGFEAGRLKEIIHGVVEKFNGSITLEKAFEPVQKLTSTIFKNMEDIVNILDSGSMEEPENKDKKSKVYPAMLERAHQRKQAASEAEGLRWQLEKKDAEILDLKKNIKSRLEDISNYKLRLEMAEARMDSSGKQENAKSQLLETKIDQLNSELKKKSIEYDEALDTMSKELKSLENENEELKKNHKNIAKRVLLQNIQTMESRAATSSSSLVNTPISNVGKAELNLLELQLSECQSSLRATVLENVKLKSEIANLNNPGGVLQVPDWITGPETLRASSRDDVLSQITREAEQLKRDELLYMVYIPDLSLPKNKRDELETQFEKEKQLYNDRVETLRCRLRRYWDESCPGESFPSGSFGFEPEPVQSTVLESEEPSFNSVLSSWGIKV